MKKTICIVGLSILLVASAFAQVIGWHWWRVGNDMISDGHYIATYTTGKEVIVCDEMYGDINSYMEGYAHGTTKGTTVATSCVLVKSGK